MKRYILLVYFSCFFCALNAQDQKPNIVVILSDDAGYADFGFTGSNDFKTPHVDNLAEQGMVFTNAYVTASVCGPSRAGLLTGRYQQRFGFVHNNVPGCIDKRAGLWGENMGLPKDEKTLADYLKVQGYTSAVIGKWHQGHGEGFHPLDRGFDYFYGFLGGARNYFTSAKITAENQLWENRKKVKEPHMYLTRSLGEKACQFVEASSDDPFFLYLSFNAVHSPFEAEEELKKHYPELKGGRQTLAAMTQAMDEEIGKLLRKLREFGLDENTLVIFTNDNGGTSYYYADNSPFNGTKSTNLEGGNRVPFIMKWQGKIKEGKQYDFPISTLDIVPTALALSGTNSNENLLDGVNLLPYLNGEINTRPHKTLYWMVDGPFAAMRDMDWKLIEMPDRMPELYDLATDVAEKHNLALKYPELTQGLLMKLYSWKNEMAPAHWQLQKKYELHAIERYDKFRK